MNIICNSIEKPPLSFLKMVYFQWGRRKKENPFPTVVPCPGNEMSGLNEQTILHGDRDSREP